VAAIGATAAALLWAALPGWEGVSWRTYRDPAEILTACVGHTGADVRPGATHTPAQCARWLADDILAADAALRRCIGDAAVQALPGHVRAALNSLMFNVGPGRQGHRDGICVLRDGRPSTLVLAARRGDLAETCAQISRWRWMQGRDCALPQHRSTCGGLVTRRADERAMCEGRSLPQPVQQQLQALLAASARARAGVAAQASAAAPAPATAPTQPPARGAR
jgi:lysozyme